MQFQRQPKSDYDVICLDSVDSTSGFLKRYLQENESCKPLVCTTKIQTAGYGQQGRRWQTNENSAIFSIAIPVPKKLQLSASVSLKTAISLHSSLSELIDYPLRLKWPNDLYDSKGKVCGLLIEQLFNKERRYLIFGIGVNRTTIRLDGLRASAYKASAVPYFSTDSLFSQLIPRLVSMSYSENLHPKQQAYWVENDLFSIKETVLLVNDKYHQTVQYGGIDEQGLATVLLKGKSLTLASGLHSLRKLGDEF